MLGSSTSATSATSITWMASSEGRNSNSLQWVPPSRVEHFWSRGPYNTVPPLFCFIRCNAALLITALLCLIMCGSSPPSGSRLKTPITMVERCFSPAFNTIAPGLCYPHGGEGETSVNASLFSPFWDAVNQLMGLQFLSGDVSFDDAAVTWFLLLALIFVLI